MGIGISNPPPGSSGTSSAIFRVTRKPRSFAINEKDSDYSPVGRGRISSNVNASSNMTTDLNLTQEWDKTFALSNKVSHEKVTFTTSAHTRIKATAAMTMYDMSRVNGNGYFDADDSEQARHNSREAWASARMVDLESGSFAQAGGVVDPLPEDAPQFVKDYYDYYKTPGASHCDHYDGGKDKVIPWDRLDTFFRSNL